MIHPIDELRRWQRTLGWSVEGFMLCWREEKSLRQWAYLNIASVGLMIWLRPDAAFVAMILGFGMLTLITELMNSAVEKTVDYISTDRHPLAKAAKDIASAAVFLSGLTFGAVWVVTLIAL